MRAGGEPKAGRRFHYRVGAQIHHVAVGVEQSDAVVDLPPDAMQEAELQPDPELLRQRLGLGQVGAVRRLPDLQEAAQEVLLGRLRHGAEGGVGGVHGFNHVSLEKPFRHQHQPCALLRRLGGRALDRLPVGGLVPLHGDEAGRGDQHRPGRPHGLAVLLAEDLRVGG